LPVWLLVWLLMMLLLLPAPVCSRGHQLVRMAHAAGCSTM
jgi:hypothetical protein